MDSKKYDILINRLAMKYRKPSNAIRKMVESQFEFIQHQSKLIDLSKVESKEDLNEIKTNFNLKYLFSLVVSYKSLKKIKDANNAKN